MRHGVPALIVAAVLMNTSIAAETQPAPDWPADWAAAWNEPPVDCRPLQIVHSLTPPQATPEILTRTRAAGLGGFVCNVNFDGYLTSETRWAELKQIVENCRQAGLIVWIYDEKGYPSGAAGGEVLASNPAFEARALTYDPSLSEPFAIRPAYEYAHASNNYHACRRCPNIIDTGAIRRFIEVTHAAYANHLNSYFGSTIRAFFTDEPSLMGVNIGTLPENVRVKVPVVDPVDPNVKDLPMIPWAADLPDLYRQRFNADLLAVRRSLFEGDSEQDRQTRARFWSLIADLAAERYFGQIQDWCGSHHVASSGHTLHEEQLIAQVPLAGNSLKALSRMDIPGLDVLTSDPHAVVDGMWLTASLPTSAALLNGRRLVMTEVSDFQQKMATGKSVTTAAMQATAAWQAALGVTEFTLYYDTIWRLCSQLPAEKIRDLGRPYTDYVGRLNALLRAARPVHRVLLYYPIADLWAEYKPVAGPLTLDSQSPRARRIVGSFHRLGRAMLTRQIPFLLADREMLDRAETRDRKLYVGGQPFAAVVFPDGVTLPASSPALDQFAKQGGIILKDATDKPVDLAALAGIDPLGSIEPAGPEIVAGQFERDGRQICLLVNVGPQPYAGQVHVGDTSQWWKADPATGRVESTPPPHAGRIPIHLAPQSALLITSSPNDPR